MRKLYAATVKGISNRTPKDVWFGPRDDEADFTINKQITLVDINDAQTGIVELSEITLDETKKWSQVSSIIFVGNSIFFEAEIVGGKIVRPTNFCSEHSVMRIWDQPGVEIPHVSDTLKCCFCKHKGKKECLSLDI